MTPLEFDDAIAAIASAPGPAQRGIVRISGEQIGSLLRNCWEPDDRAAWENAQLPRLHTGQFQLEADLWLPVEVAWWPTNRSYAGRPMAEIHTLGSPPVLQQILDRLQEAGIRLAKPGEFSLRAFLAGRIDLVQAEAVLGVIDARGEDDLQVALNQLAGGISGKLKEMRVDLIDLLADLEAGLDFVEEDIEFVTRDQIVRRTQNALLLVQHYAQHTAERMVSDHRYHVVLAGLPNAGKSTLLNRLAEQDAAIVSSLPGTTRDYLAVQCQLDGLDVQIVDTAGWEVSDDPAMHDAQKFREAQSRQADLVVWCHPYGLPETDAVGSLDQYAACEQIARTTMLVQTKSDLKRNDQSDLENAAVEVSAESGLGIENLTAAIVRILSDENAPQRQLIGSTSARCGATLDNVTHSLRQASEAASGGLGDEVIALEIRLALDGLGEIVGAVYTDDLLDRVFSKFCIGK